MKDASNLIHRVHYNASQEKTDHPMLFEIKPNQTENATCGEGLSHNGQRCESPYCTKLIIDLTEVASVHSGGVSTSESEVPITFAIVLISKDIFDPIRHPEMIE